jgi:hypothetical protein
MRTELPYLSNEPDRHGNERLYVRRNGKRIRLKEPEGTPAFAKAYSAAVDALALRAPSTTTQAPATHPPGSLGWLGARYFASRQFAGIAKASQRARRNCLEECFREPLSDADADPLGNCPLKFVSTQKLRRLVDRKADQPGAAANRRKHLSALWRLGRRP